MPRREKFQTVSSLLVLMRSSAAVTAFVTLAMPALAAPPQVRSVFVIAMENHNWTQPDGNVGDLSTIQQIKGNPNAPFINSLVNGTAMAQIGGVPANISQQTAYADAYHNVLYNSATGTAPHIHPSEPNYIWSEAGTNFGVLNDHQRGSRRPGRYSVPASEEYCSPDAVLRSGAHRERRVRGPRLP